MVQQDEEARAANPREVLPGPARETRERKADALKDGKCCAKEGNRITINRGKSAG
jgi:hypothetical protein